VYTCRLIRADIFSLETFFAELRIIRVLTTWECWWLRDWAIFSSCCSCLSVKIIFVAFSQRIKVNCPNYDSSDDHDGLWFGISTLSAQKIFRIILTNNAPKSYLIQITNNSRIIVQTTNQRIKVNCLNCDSSDDHDELWFGISTLSAQKIFRIILTNNGPKSYLIQITNNSRIIAHHLIRRITVQTTNESKSIVWTMIHLMTMMDYDSASALYLHKKYFG